MTKYKMIMTTFKIILEYNAINDEQETTNRNYYIVCIHIYLLYLNNNLLA